jgi:hypothetical protein
MMFRNRITCSYLFSNHVDRVLDTAIGDDRDDGSINDTEVLDAVDAKTGINNTLLDALGKTSSTTRVCPIC